MKRGGKNRLPQAAITDCPKQQFHEEVYQDEIIRAF